MSRSFYQRQQKVFKENHSLYWTNLSRFNGLLIIVNVSMFFLTGLVTQGYYYTCYSLVGLSIIAVALLIPTHLVRNLGYYLIILLVEAVSSYFLVASVVYWIRNSG